MATPTIRDPDQWIVFTDYTQLTHIPACVAVVLSVKGKRGN